MTVYYIAPYFSRACYCRIPGHWRAEQGRFYGDGATREEAIATLRANMAGRA